MNTLRTGTSGDAVTQLQTRLAALGFPPGKIDGDFGPGTEAALINFQKSQGLVADGVAGPRTLAALGLADDDTLPSVIPDVTVGGVNNQPQQLMFSSGFGEFHIEQKRAVNLYR